MSLWLVRAGKHGEFEAKFLDDSRIYLTWQGLDRDLAIVGDKEQLKKILAEQHPNATQGRVQNHANQIWQFSHRMAKQDWVVLPSKLKGTIHVGRILSNYKFDGAAPDPYYHHRDVEWLRTDLPRSHFSQDLLYSFGAFLSVCRIKRNDAEARLKAMANGGWKPEDPTVKGPSIEPDDTDEEVAGEGHDVEQVARDEIAKLVIQRFKGYPMERLVENILQAKGYTTHSPPEGADKGVDILAGAGPLGFDNPRLCVQVKTGDDQVGHPVLSQLIGTMQNVNAEHGLLVSWSGFKKSVLSEVANQFFRVRLWDADVLIHELLANYERLSEEIRSEIPLKRVWAIAQTED